MTVEPDTLELFGGPGGWAEGLRMLGAADRSVAVEWCPTACATRSAAGHAVVQGDVSRLDTTVVAREWFGSRRLRGLIASPPCQTFSASGSGAGRLCEEILHAAIVDAFHGRTTRGRRRSEMVAVLKAWLLTHAGRRGRPRAERSAEAWRIARNASLVIEPARFIHDLRYGVPQTRERAFVLASRTRQVEPPRPTHQRYVPGEAARHELTFDGDLLPWVSMADALGWATGGGCSR